MGLEKNGQRMKIGEDREYSQWEKVMKKRLYSSGAVLNGPSQCRVLVWASLDSRAPLNAEPHQRPLSSM